MFYRQVTTVASLEALPIESVVFFNGICAVKSSTGEWLIAGEKDPVDSRVLHSISSTLYVISEYTFFPVEGFDSGRVNLKYVLQLISRYGEVNWINLFEWTRDFYGVSLEEARAAIQELVRLNRIEDAGNGNVRLAR